MERRWPLPLVVWSAGRTGSHSWREYSSDISAEHLRRISRSPRVPPEAAVALPALPPEYSAATAGLAVESAPHEDMICHPTRGMLLLLLGFAVHETPGSDGIFW